MNNLVGLEDFGGGEHLCLQLHGLDVDLEAPVGDALLLEKILAHLLDTIYFFAGVDSCRF